MITESGSAFQNALLWFFNLAWDWEQYPTPWGHSHIRYLHKKNYKLVRSLQLQTDQPRLVSRQSLHVPGTPRIQEAIQPYIAPEQGGF